MRFLTVHFFRRLRREGIKSIIVPLLAFVLVVLINILGGIKERLETDYEYMMDEYPIIAELSDLTGETADGINIGEKYIGLFTDPDAPLSLQEYTGDIAMKRGMEITRVSGLPANGTLIGITGIMADDIFSGSEIGAFITFYEGFDESIFKTDGLYCAVSEDMLKNVKDGVLSIIIRAKPPDTISNYREEATIAAELTVVGTVSGADSGSVYAPFWTVTAFGTEGFDTPPYTERLFITLANNRELPHFKQRAALSFPRVRPIHDTRPFAMTIYDSDFYETLESLRQNILFVDFASPFLYILSVGIGFFASVQLSRRRKPEFAVMRSVGIHKRDIFLGALAEQAALSIAGAALGCALVAAAWGYLSFERPAIFLACYIFGTVFSAARSAGTNVLKIFHERG
jgi:ABC-type antimicrobial peptide transport system permease subunit